MRFLLACLGLAEIWVAITGGFTGPNLILGSILGATILVLSPGATRLRRSRRIRAGLAKRLLYALDLIAYIIWETVLPSLRVAWDVLSPRHRMSPGIVALELEEMTEAELTFLTAVITLTPGTLAIDISDDRQVMYVHLMYISDVEAEREKLKTGFERRVLKLVR